jgi:hypothetical protein
MSKVKEACKFYSLKVLKDIQENQYRGKDGKEYIPEIIDELIWEKEEKIFDKQIAEQLKRYNYAA